MNSAVKNFSRYTFHPDGSVTNTASKKAIAFKTGTTDTYQLLNDSGAKVTVKIGVVKAEAAKGTTAPAKKEAKPKKAAAPKKAAKKKDAVKREKSGKTHKPTLNYALAQEIRKKVSQGMSKTDVAAEYGVSSGTIYFTCNYTNYPLKPGDKAWIAVPEGWKPRKERNAAKAKASKKK